MKLEEIKSKAELSKFIESYWHFDGIIDPSLMLLPDGTFNVVVSKSGFQVGAIKYPAGIFLIPISTRPIVLKSSSVIFGIRFKAFSMINIAGKKVNSLGLINRIEDCTVKSVRSAGLNSVFKQNLHLEEIKTHLENLAFDLLNHHYYLNENLRAQVNYLLDRKGDVKITSLCEDLGITRQGLHKSFKAALGIGAKELAMTWRLNYYFTLMTGGDTLTGTAIDAGFFDQAHSINSFKSKWLLSPSNLQKQNPVVFHFAQKSMNRRFSNFYDPEV